MGSCPACDRESRALVAHGRYLDFTFDYFRCLSCASIFVDPMPNADVLDRMYAPEYIAEHYSAELIAEQSSRDLAAESVAALELIRSRKPGARLLDVGCGAGQFLVAARDAGFRSEGIERNADTAHMIAKRIGIDVHAGDLSGLIGPYDVIHFADVLEHQPRPLDMLKAACRLLASDGLVVARGPLEGQPNVFLWAVRAQRRVREAFGLRRTFEMPPWHVIQFSLAGWHALLRRAGLVEVHESLYEVHWPAPEQPTWSSKWILKAISLRITNSALGRSIRLGNRVVSVLAI